MMNQASMIKYGIFLLSVLVLVGIDQWTKQIAEERLATQRPGFFSHNMVLEIGEEHQGSTLEEYLRDELHRNSEEEISRIARRFTVTPEGELLNPMTVLAAGDTIEIRQREIVVIEGFWDYQYTRNPGAAFGLLADADESFRKPFFIGVSILAMLIILGLLRTVPFRQQIMFWGLTLIAAGAMGNFIDRILFGYVIDFVVWKYTDEHRWPTFNVADVLICIGVGLIFLEMIREFRAEMKEKKTLKAEEKA